MIARVLMFLWIVFALASASAAIWFGLPFVGDEFLARPEVRGGVIFCVLFIFFFASRFRKWRQTRSATAIEEELTAVQGMAIQSDAEVLAERMGEAVSQLKSSRGSASLYTLPWYVLIGPPGAGKTTALVHSGLAFPSTKPASVSGVGGTRNCDFWFSEDAVLVDTAGRYTTQESDAAGDAKEWGAFLKELKRFRADQPINGVLLAFSCADLMLGDDVTIAAHAAAVRARLGELRAALRVRAPVYAVFTKADLIAGFREYFGRLDAGERKKVWGATFQTRNSREDTQEQVGREFDQLIARLGDQIPLRMAGEKDTATRHALMRFPEQMEAIKGNIALFLRLVFQGDAGKQSILRGFYFTSGTQEGTPFDQVVGAMLGGEEARAGGFLSGRGKSYFLHDLLREVIFPERGWVGHDRRRVRIRSFLRGTGIAAVACAALAATGLVGLRFWENATLVRTAEQQGAFYVREAGPVLRQSVVEEDNPRALFEALALVRDLPGGYSDEAGPITAALFGDLGLSRRDGIERSALGAYSDALERLLRPRMMIRLERDLAGAIADRDHRRAFEALRVYLLTAKAQEGAGDDVAIQHYFARSWAADFAGDDQGYQEVNRHLAAMLELDDRVTPVVQPAEAIVATAREALAGLSDAEIVLASVAGQGGRLKPLVPFAGIGAEGALRVSDGRALATIVVDPLRTPAGFEAVMADVLARPEAVLTREAWVLGRAPGQGAGLRQELVALYNADIADLWRGILERIEPTPQTGAALGGAVRSLTEAVAAALDFPDSELILKDKMEIQAWRELAANEQEKARLEAAMAQVGQARDFGEVSAALEGLPDQRNYPLPLRALVKRAGEVVRASLVRDEVIAVALECQALVRGRYPFAPVGAPPMPLSDFERLVSDQGILAELARAHAAREGVGGALPRPVRDVIGKGAALGAAFFGAAGPEREVEISLVTASQSIQGVELRAGNQSALLTIDGAPLRLRWPWDGQGGLSLEAQPPLTDLPEVLSFDAGIWAMLPLLTEAKDARRAGSIIEVAHGIGSRTVILRLDFGTPDIPFLRPELTSLRCPQVR
ncbi:MAG: type VI secretion system membrane subunit TssM [Pseudomonadota bacterium]